MKTQKSHVFCPNCSSKNNIEQNFCRACGLNLQETIKSLSAQQVSEKNASQLKQLKSLKKLEDYAVIGLTATVLAGLTIFLYGVATKMIFPGLRIFPAIVIAFIIFNYAMRYVRRLKRSRIADDREKTETNELQTRETAKLLEDKPFTPAPAAASVAENSTELLFMENKTKKLR